VQQRFAELRDRIALLKRLADAHEIDEIRDLDDVTPLLFEHTVYKSYPRSLLLERRFDQLTAWLGKLTTHDLRHVNVSDCDSLDAWLARMDVESPLTIGHSSGTTGTVSFMPYSKEELDGWGRQGVVAVFQNVGDARPADPIPDVHVVCPYYRSGTSMLLRYNEMHLKYYAGGDESRFHAAFPEPLSSDVTVLAARIRAAIADGTAGKIDVSADMRARIREHEGKLATMEEQLRQFLEGTIDQLKGERVYIGGVWTLIHPLAAAGLRRGVRGVFAPDSAVLCAGGGKGLVQPPGWKQEVAEFSGVPALKMMYGMSEIAAHNMLCSKGRYHLHPTVVPFVLDPDTGVPLPRTGVVTGRAAFFDLAANSHWGGAVTGDRVTFHWDEPCPCGATSVFIDDDIVRYSELRGGDDKITCAAQPQAHADALGFLDTWS
jgi:hypothetical protein